MTCAEDGDRRRFIKAVNGMHRLANTLATVQVCIAVTETESGHPPTIASAARDNRDELLTPAPWVAAGDLSAAQEAQPYDG